MVKLVLSLIILVISVACTIKGQDYQSFPLREFKRKLSPEGKLTYPFTDKLVSHFHYFTEKDKEFYKLIYDQNQNMVGFSVTNSGSNEIVERIGEFEFNMDEFFTKTLNINFLLKKMLFAKRINITKLSLKCSQNRF
jgi:hypothetical protein